MFTYIYIYICLQKATRESDRERYEDKYYNVQRKEDVYLQWYFPLIKYFLGTENRKFRNVANDRREFQKI